MAGRRAALYARYSTTHQNDKSVADQLHECRRYAEANGLVVVREFSDAAKSGGSILGRDGLIELLASAGRRDFEVVVVEALDRLSRDMEDLAGIHKRFRFAGIDLLAVNDGKASTVLVGLRGLVGQLFREDGAEKVKRGMSGVLRSGRNPGGKAYGYRPIPGKPGELSIEPDEAATVRRIFERYASGATPRDIAGELNRDRVPPPRGARWNASTINGNAARAHGILTNPIYTGRIVWNRVSMVRDPDTGKRVSRPNPESAWQSAEAPHLRIIEPELWEAVTARKAGRSVKSGNPLVRTKRLLSGLLRCGCCGAGMSVQGRIRGRTRIVCSQAVEAGTCPSTKRVFLDAIEQTVISGLREQLSAPDVLSEYLKTYREERRAAADTATRDRDRAERRLRSVEASIDRIVRAIGDGVMTSEEARAALPPLREEKAALEIRLEDARRELAVIELHPEAVTAYRRDLDRLADALRGAVEDVDPEATAALRTLVDRVVVTPGGPYEPPLVEVMGRLAAITGAPIRPNGKLSRSVAGGLVAEERFDRNGHTEIVFLGAWRARRDAA